MAFSGGRVSRLAMCLATSLVAGTAVGQSYQQPAAQPAQPQYPSQPATYGSAPARPQAQAAPAQPGPAPQQPVTYAAAPPASFTSAATAPAPTYGNPPAGAAAAQNPAAQYPATQYPTANNGAYNRSAPASAPAGGGYATQNNGAVPPAGSATPMYAAPSRPAPTPASNPLRRATYEQPVDGQQPAASQPAAPAQPAAAPAPAQAQPAASPMAAGGQSAPSSTPPPTVPADVLAGLTANEHPLAPALRWAKDGYKNVDKLNDYSCTLVKRERIDGELGEHEYAFVKVRHRPFSVYMYFLGPAKVKGREALFVQGQNDDKLLAHDNGVRHRMIGTVSLKPDGNIARSGNRYPITEMGMRRLLERLIEIGDNDMKYGECTVQWIQNAKVDGRVCTCIQVVHPVPRRNFLFHLARIYVDDEMQLPIRYEAYDWPARAGEPPQLTEEYTFLKVKVNNGFTDADFSVENPAYGFK